MSIDDPEIPLGQNLAEAITTLGLSRRKFAKLAGTDEPTIANWVKNPAVKPTRELRLGAKRVLDMGCRCCGHYTEKPDAWDNSKTSSAKGQRNRK